MNNRKSRQAVDLAFEHQVQRVPVEMLQTLYSVTASTKAAIKYQQIEASIAEIGLVEPIAIARDRSNKDHFIVLDGHIRLEILKARGAKDVDCLISTDDEAFTYNKRISRLVPIQEHKMIAKAIARGVSEDRIARALNININTLRGKKRLLDGICEEATSLLSDKPAAQSVFVFLKKMKTMRQIEAAELMVTMNNYTVNYARSLLAATPDVLLRNAGKAKVVKGVSSQQVALQQVALMERESTNLQQELKLVEKTYGTDHLDLVVARGYVSQLIKNKRILRFLDQNYSEYAGELRRILIQAQDCDKA